MQNSKVGSISFKFSSLVLTVLVLSSLTFSSVSARTIMYCPPIEAAGYTELVDTWYASAGIDGFSLSGFSFCGNENGDVSGNITLFSDRLSELGLRYVLTLSVTANKNVGTIKRNSEVDVSKIEQRVRQFESKKEVKDFVERFRSALTKDVFLFTFRVQAGAYFLEYDEKKDEFLRYSLPIAMSDDFPALTGFKDKVDATGCSIEKDSAITYIENKYWNTKTLYSVVDGDCKRSDTYTPPVFEVEYPIQTDIWTRIKVWLKRLWH